MNVLGEWLALLAWPLAAAQTGLMLVDEIVYHRRRVLGVWESWGHAFDSVVFAAALAPAALLAPSRRAALLFVVLAAASSLLATKDEWMHARECEPTEHWVHALLFVLHPCVLIAVGALWSLGEGRVLRFALPVLALGYALYQWAYWIGGRRARAEIDVVDNDFYDELGAEWHEGDAHAIALLRAETPTRFAYVRAVLEREGVRPGARVLDVGCGGGFLSLPLAAAGWRVKGIDRSEPSLDAARARIPAGASAEFAVGDALALEEPEGSCEAVLLMDLLEHLDEPARAVAEAARVLKPGGVLLFHTFNRTLPSWLLAVKGIGLVTTHGPHNVHVYRLLVKPAELEAAGRAAGLEPRERRGIRPVLGRALLWSFLHRRIHPEFAFTLTRSTAVGYLGYFVKPRVVAASAAG
jgi:2-polyprenyl-6-hydroxyphenyl methylase/3-demethylubiquinone-9 3-methyltransferase